MNERARPFESAATLADAKQLTTSESLNAPACLDHLENENTCLKEEIEAGTMVITITTSGTTTTRPPAEIIADDATSGHNHALVAARLKAERGTNGDDEKVHGEHGRQQ